MGTKVANLPDILAALLPPQIETIDQRLPRRQEVAERYREAFGNGPLRLVREVPETKSAEHIFTIGVPNGKRDDAIATLNAAGIHVAVNFRSVPGTRYYTPKIPASAWRMPCCRPMVQPDLDAAHVSQPDAGRAGLRHQGGPREGLSPRKTTSLTD